jgi:hypothetical protein
MTQINAAQNEQIAPLELITLEQIEVAVQAAQSAGATAGCGDVNMSHGQMTRLIASLGAVRPGELVPLLVRCWLESAWRDGWEANTPGPETVAPAD